MMPSPICLFVYKRPKHTRLTVESLLKNPEARDSILYVFGDGPKTEIDHQDVELVKNYLLGVQGFKEIHFNWNVKNQGLAPSIISGVSSVLEKHSTVIILEDDMVLSPYFLKFMNDALEKYSSTMEVACVHGYIYPSTLPRPETFFLKGADCWGWGTWSRAWAEFEADGQKLLTELENRNLTYEFDFDGTYPYTDMLRRQIRGEVSSWAIRWYASAFLKDRLCLYPGQSLLNNIGFDNSGENCAADPCFEVELARHPVLIGDLPLIEDLKAKRTVKLFFMSLKPSFLNRIRLKVLRFLKWRR